MGDCCPIGDNSIIKTYLNTTFEMIETNITFLAPLLFSLVEVCWALWNLVMFDSVDDPT